MLRPLQLLHNRNRSDAYKLEFQSDFSGSKKHQL